MCHLETFTHLVRTGLQESVFAVEVVVQTEDVVVFAER